MQHKDRIQAILADRRTTRREFFEGALALGLSATAATSMWSNAAKATPKKGGHLRIGLAGAAQKNTLDPTTFDDTFMISVGHSIRDNLTSIGTDGNIEPAAAESWESSSDAATWIFKIRKGAEFSNGKSLEAEDVIASFNAHRGEESKSAGKVILEPVEEMTATDKHTVTFKLKSGNADFPFSLSSYRMNIVPSKDGIPDWQSGIGTGAYILESFDPGIGAKLKLNPNRWNQEVGHVETAELIAVNDAVARQSALVTGAVDAITRVELKTAHLLAKNPAVRVDEVTGLKHFSFPMNSKMAPFDNNDVRLALKYAIDREEILHKVLRGHGAIANDQPIAPANRYYANDLPQHVFDPEKAKFHLRKAGLDNLKVDLSASDGIVSGGVDMALLYREQAAKANIDINVVREAADGWWDDVWMKKPFIVGYWGGRATEDWMLTVAYSSGAPWNDSYWEHERFNKLLIEARSELDEGKRRQLYREMQLIIHNEGAAIIPLYANHVFAVQNNVQYGQIAGNWELDGGKAIERWWFA